MEYKRPATYNTRQGQSILDYMKSLGDSHVTANQIARHFEDAGDIVGQATIYRHLEKLAAQGNIRKYVLNEGKSACYQYIDTGGQCREHFHLKCDVCGSLICADCDILDGIEGSLSGRYDFHINLIKTVFYGTCKNCLSAGPATEGIR
jgi:Fur family ferric uptake transcriptional regulator